MLKVVKSTKSTQTSDTAKTSKAKEVLLNILPLRLLGDVKDNILYFRDMNPSMPFKTLKKLNRNIEIQHLNAKAYAEKEKDIVREYIELRDGIPLTWNQKSTEKTYEDTLDEDGEVNGKRLAGGKFVVEKTPSGLLFFEEDYEQYVPLENEQMKYLQKDDEKEEEYIKKIAAVQKSPIEVRIVLFTEDDLEGLNVPSDPVFTDVFCKGIIND